MQKQTQKKVVILKKYFQKQSSYEFFGKHEKREEQEGKTTHQNGFLD